MGKSLVLHLLPGALITAFFALLAPVLLRAGYPSLFTLLLAVLVVLVPFELGYLLHEGRRLNGRWSLRGVVLYREPVPRWQYFLLVPILLFWAAFVFTVVTKPIDSFLIAKLFPWLPSWFQLAKLDFGRYSGAVLKVTLLMNLALNGVLGPLVEELYFRGYLLPRISRFRWGAPLLNVALFSLYHFFSPWQNPGRILALIPLVYAVWWKRNINIGIGPWIP
ncbi:MAG: lysostaphin resistance A-like protein [Chitinophagales bacterium]